MRMKWCFVNMMFKDNNFVNRLRELQDGHTVPQPHPNAPTLEEACELTGRQVMVKSIEDFDVDDLLHGDSPVIRQITSFAKSSSTDNLGFSSAS